MTAKLAAKYTTALATLRDRKEAGATGLEYAGMIMVAALIVGLVYGAVDSANIDTKVGDAIDKLFSGGKTAGGSGGSPT